MTRRPTCRRRCCGLAIAPLAAGDPNAVLGGPGSGCGVSGDFLVPIADNPKRLDDRVARASPGFISLGTHPSPNIVTAVTIEEGGFGAESAAPANLQMLEAYFNKKATSVTTEGGAE
jgi:hypothetical protein